MDMESWHEDDTVYSEVICDAEDTFYHGSEDEQYETPAERRRRYKVSANRFLDGEQRSILSASLRGPFEAHKGWVNPWRSRRHARRSISGPEPTKQATGRAQDEQPADTQDSFESHLPSPESLKQVEIVVSHRFLEDEDVDRVQKWQSSVQHGDGSIDFASGSQKSTSQKKRRAKNSDWLRQSSSKKRRTDSAEAGLIKTPSRRSRKAPLPSSPTGLNSAFKASFQSSQLCPGGRDGDDELAVDDEPGEAPRAFFSSSQKRQLSPKSRISPKRSMLKRPSSEHVESADELSQETSKETQAAATLSSPVSIGKQIGVPPTRKHHSSPLKKKPDVALPTCHSSPTWKKSNAPTPEITGSPVKKLRTPRLRKSRMKHKIEALRAPLPRQGQKEVENAATATVVEPQPEPKTTSFSETQEESSKFDTHRQTGVDHEEVLGLMNPRASSPLSEISSSHGSVSWAGLSPAGKSEAPLTRDTSTQSTTSSNNGDEKDGGEAEQGQIDVDIHDADHDSNASSDFSRLSTADVQIRASSMVRMEEQMLPSEKQRLDEELDFDAEEDCSETSSETSDLSMADVQIRASSVIRMEEQMPASQQQRLDAELDLDDDASDASAEEPSASDNDVSAYETAGEDGRQTTPTPRLEATPKGLLPATVRAGDLLDTETNPAREHSSGLSSENTTEVVEPVESVENETIHTEGTMEVPSVAVETCVAFNPFEINQTSSNDGRTEQANDGVREAVTSQIGPLPQSSFDPILSNEQAVTLYSGPATAWDSMPPRPSTPDTALNPFAAFMSPSPDKNNRQRRVANMRASLKRVSGADGSSIISIMKGPWDESKPSKRVSFASLPSEQEDQPFSTAPERTDQERPGSPPPQTAVEDLPTSNEAEFQRHFKAVAKRTSKNPLRVPSSDSSSSPSLQETHTLGGSLLAPDKMEATTEISDSEAPSKSIFDGFDTENEPPGTRDEDIDDVFDEMSLMLQPYDLEAELDEANMAGQVGMDSISFGGW